MKKKLQSQIRALAEQILAESDSKDTAKMKETARRLYEQLTVLEYLEVQIFGTDEPGEKVESLDSKSFREHNWFKEPEPVPQPEDREAIVEPVMEKIKDLVAQMPEESQKVDALLEEVLPRKEYKKNDLEEFASDYQEMPVFEPKDEPEIKHREKNGSNEVTTSVEKSTHNDVDRPKSLNEKLNNSLQIGLNDRLAFIKHLFNGSTEDYTRVIGQINSYQTFEEADTFIKAKVKPDYNYWLQKDEFSKRFMKIVRNSFE